MKKTRRWDVEEISRCQRCGSENVFYGVVERVLQKDSRGRIARSILGDPEWRVVSEWVRCPVCSPERGSEAKFRTILELDNRPTYLVIRDDYHRIEAPDGSHRTTAGSDEEIIEMISEVAVGRPVSIVWVEDRPSRLTILRDDGLTTVSPDDDLSYEDHVGDRHDHEVRLFGETRHDNDRFVDVSVDSEHRWNLRAHDIFSDSDDDLVHWLPGECPVCERPSPTQLYGHVRGSEVLVEHLVCNRIVGKIPSCHPDTEEMSYTGSQSSELRDEVEDILEEGPLG